MPNSNPLPEETATGRRALVWGLGTAAVLLLFYPVLRDVFRLSLEERQHYSHLPLIPFVSAYLFYIERDRIFSSVRWAPWWGAALSAAGLAAAGGALLLGGRLGEIDSLSMLTLALVVVWFGLFLAVYGPAAVKEGLFPLGFLLFAVPLPGIVLDPLIGSLQTWSAEATALLFRFSGVPVYRDGFLFQMPGLVIEVARECSGIRSTLALLITAALTAHLFIRRWPSRIALFLLVFPLTVVKNGVRIVGLSLLYIYVDEGFMEGNLHRDGGILFFILALVMAAPVFFLLLRFEDDPERSDRPASVWGKLLRRSKALIGR